MRHVDDKTPGLESDDTFFYSGMKMYDAFETKAFALRCCTATHHISVRLVFYFCQLKTSEDGGSYGGDIFTDGLHESLA